MCSGRAQEPSNVHGDAQRSNPREIKTLHRAYSPSVAEDEVQILEKLFYG